MTSVPPVHCCVAAIVHVRTVVVVEHSLAGARDAGANLERTVPVAARLLDFHRAADADGVAVVKDNVGIAADSTNQGPALHGHVQVLDGAVAERSRHGRTCGRHGTACVGTRIVQPECGAAVQRDRTGSQASAGVGA